MGSSSSIRAFVATLRRFSHGFSSKCPYSFSLQKNGLLKRNLSFPSTVSTYSPLCSYENNYSGHYLQARKIWAFHPVCMGRRSCKIAGRKVYGYGGVSMVVEVSTDKINRSVAAVREVVKDYGGKMADPGSVMFKFRRVRVVNVKVTNVDKDHLLAIALDAGAEDVIEPPLYEDDTEEERSESYYKIVSASENYAEILSKLREDGMKFEPDNGSELLPMTTIEVDDEAMELNKELMSKLLELDDVDAVYTDQQ